MKHNENTYRGPLFTQVSEVSPNSLPVHNGTETTLAACPEAEVQALSAAIVAGKGESK